MILWKMEKRKISELKCYEKNPRTLSDRENRQLSNSLEKFGLADKPVLNLDNTIIGGHQRISILQEKEIEEVECSIPSRLLNEEEIRELNARLNLNGGSWDYDILANSYDVGDLLSWGFEEDELGLGKPEKPKKKIKYTISLEFSDQETMLNYIQKCEEIAQESSAKMKVKG